MVAARGSSGKGALPKLLPDEAPGSIGMGGLTAISVGIAAAYFLPRTVRPSENPTT
jgi:hypothetical protein